MSAFLLLILLTFQLATALEQCSKEETISKLNSLLEKHYLWWDRVKNLSWKDEKELIEQLRKIGDRWTSITRQEEDRLWYSSSKMLGLGVRWDDKGYVVKVFPGSPAEKHGIKEGDLLISIQDITDKNLWRKVIREAEKGERIVVELIREGLFMKLEVKKGEFVIPAVEDMKVIRHDDIKIGYVKLANFTQPAVEGFREAMNLFNAEGVDMLLIDLRDNGGGLISVAKSIADMLIGGEGVMFYLEGRGTNMGVYQFKNREGFKKPIVVLVSRQTASAAELLAVLLRRYAKAVIVGENTAGKYVGSNVFTFDICSNSVLRLVTFEMKLPTGEPIATDKGISPDCKLENKDIIQSSFECLSNQAVEVYPSGQP